MVGFSVLVVKYKQNKVCAFQCTHTCIVWVAPCSYRQGANA